MSPAESRPCVEMKFVPKTTRATQYFMCFSRREKIVMRGHEWGYLYTPPERLSRRIMKKRTWFGNFFRKYFGFIPPLPTSWSTRCLLPLMEVK